MSGRKNVLVICTGNSCRSQMAEVILNNDLAGRVYAISAGSHPHYEVSSGAIQALELAGLPTAGLHPKSIETVMDKPIDLVVTVCDSARNYCPVFPGAVRTIHLPFHDPFGEPLASFVAVRDDIRARLVPAVRATLGIDDK